MSKRLWCKNELYLTESKLQLLCWSPPTPAGWFSFIFLKFIYGNDLSSWLVYSIEIQISVALMKGKAVIHIISSICIDSWWGNPTVSATRISQLSSWPPRGPWAQCGYGLMWFETSTFWPINQACLSKNVGLILCNFTVVEIFQFVSEHELCLLCIKVLPLTRLFSTLMVITATIISLRSASPGPMFAVGSARLWFMVVWGSLPSLWQASVSAEAMNRPKHRERLSAEPSSANKAAMTDTVSCKHGGAIGRILMCKHAFKSCTWYDFNLKWICF